jgi:FMN phosphatase YigB (HAD superfamily)
MLIVYIMRVAEPAFVDDRAVNIQAARKCGWTAIHAVGKLNRFRERYLVGPFDGRSAEGKIIESSMMRKPPQRTAQ